MGINTVDVLYHFDQVFTILEILVSEKADKFSFELRRILKRSFFSAVTRDWTLGRNGTVMRIHRWATVSGHEAGHPH